MQLATSIGVIDRSLVFRDRVTFENDNERTLNLEYRLKRAFGGLEVGALVKRSAHVHIKRWPSGAEAAVGTFLRSFRQGSGLPLNDQATRLRRLLGHGYRFANSQAMCTSFKQDILNGLHAFGTSVVRGGTGADTFKMALYLTTGSQGAATTVYSSTNELAGTGNYTQTGNTVTNATPPTTSGTTAYWTPSASVSWANLTSSGSFDCSLLYNSTAASKNAVAVFTFGAQSITAGTFTLTMPTNDSSNALIRIA